MTSARQPLHCLHLGRRKRLTVLRGQSRPRQVAPQQFGKVAGIGGVNRPARQNCQPTVARKPAIAHRIPRLTLFAIAIQIQPGEQPGIRAKGKEVRIINALGAQIIRQSGQPSILKVKVKFSQQQDIGPGFGDDRGGCNNLWVIARQHIAQQQPRSFAAERCAKRSYPQGVGQHGSS